MSGEWKLVPVEPTPEMLNVAGRALDRWREFESPGDPQRKFAHGEKHAIRWRAMLAASPSPPALDARTVEWCIKQANGLAAIYAEDERPDAVMGLNALKTVLGSLGKGG